MYSLGLDDGLVFHRCCAMDVASIGRWCNFASRAELVASMGRSQGSSSSLDGLVFADLDAWLWLCCVAG